MSQSEAGPTAADQTEGPAVGTNEGGKGKAAAVAAGTGATAAGIAGGLAVAARDTRRRVLGVPIGRRGRVRRAASTVVDKAQEPARKLGSRFSRD